ncbi:hypothetical protein GCM10028801_43140 [Nocardioides maradonensis]
MRNVRSDSALTRGWSVRACAVPSRTMLAVKRQCGMPNHIRSAWRVRAVRSCESGGGKPSPHTMLEVLGSLDGAVQQNITGRK